MLDFNKFKSHGEALLQDGSKAAGIDIPIGLMEKVYEAALGETGMELHRLNNSFAEEADRCGAAGAWFAACLMTASAIEGVLTLFCMLAKDEVESSKAYSDLSKGKSFEEKILNATFEKLIKLAAELSWVPASAVDPDLLEAAIQDFPKVIANLYPGITREIQIEKIEAFKAEPGMEMLRILQYLRNLIHPPRCRRLGVKFGAGEFESDCKFAYVVSFQVLACLFAALAEKAQARMANLNLVIEKLSPEARALFAEFVQHQIES